MNRPRYRLALWLIRFFNDVETFASSPENLVSSFSRALQGKFFVNRETLVRIRRILSLGDLRTWFHSREGRVCLEKPVTPTFRESTHVPLPEVFTFPIAGVYFSTMLNWDAEEGDDSRTVRAFFGAITKSMELLQERLAD